jgi:hypothetical protein
MVKLLGKEAEVLAALYRKEEVPFRGEAEREAKKRLQAKGLLTDDGKLTNDGLKEIERRLAIVERVNEVYDLKAAGDYVEKIRLVYEPITPFSYAWNWLGFRGVSTLETDPRRGTAYFKALDKRFWIGEKPLVKEELTFNLPSPETVEAWAKGTRVSRETSELWTMTKNYFKFFLDLKEEVYYDAYALTAFQSWTLKLLNSVWFLAAKGAFGAGKTVGGEALVKVCRHGKVASPSVAWLGRSIERLQMVPFIDEFDVIAERDNEITRMARMSQRRGMTYDRCSESGTPQSWKVFTTWIMSVHGELEDALASRTIPITTEETQDWSLPVLNTMKEQMGQALYDEFWMWYMDNIDELTEVAKVVPPEEGLGLYAPEKVNNLVNLSQLLLIKANPEEEKLKELQKKVLDGLTSKINQKQLELLGKLSGRDVEIAYHMFKLANLLGVDLTESVGKLMEIKAEVEEERKEVGSLGLLRDLLVKLYEKRRTHPNYWTSTGEFMISNKEVFAEFIPYLHDHEAAGVTPGEFKGLLRELGFDRPTSRRKMKVFTWAEIEDGAYNRFVEGEEEKPTRLALVFTGKAQRCLGLKVEMPDEVKQKTLTPEPKPKLSLKEALEQVKNWLVMSKDDDGLVDAAALSEEIKRLGFEPQKIIKILLDEYVIFEVNKVGKFGVKS